MNFSLQQKLKTNYVFQLTQAIVLDFFSEVFFLYDIWNICGIKCDGIHLKNLATPIKFAENCIYLALEAQIGYLAKVESKGSNSKKKTQFDIFYRNNNILVFSSSQIDWNPFNAQNKTE